MNDPFAELSLRARTYLAEVGCERVAPVATREEIAAMFDPALDAELLDRIAQLEQRVGGLIVDPKKTNLELGLAALATYGLPPEMLENGDGVLFGTEEDADIFVDRRGWVWASTAGDAGEQAVSVDKYIERMAALGRKPWPGLDHFTLFCEPRPGDVIRVLGLAVDDIASDEVATLAFSDRHRLIAQRRGTEWLTSRIKLQCRDYAALRHALTVFHAQLPDLGACIASGHPSWEVSRVPTKDALLPPALEADIRSRSAARIGSPCGGAIHLLLDGGIEAYGLRENGSLANHHQLTSSGGRYREHYRG